MRATIQSSAARPARDLLRDVPLAHLGVLVVADDEVGPAAGRHIDDLVPRQPEEHSDDRPRLQGGAQSGKVHRIISRPPSTDSTWPVM